MPEMPANNEHGYLELDAEQTLRAARYHYATSPVLVIFGLLDDGTVHTVTSQDASGPELLWAVKAMELSTLTDAEEPHPLTPKTWKRIESGEAKISEPNEALEDAYNRMKHCAHAMVVAIDEEGQSSMLFSKEVDFMLINYCADWFRHVFFAETLAIEN